MHDGLQVYYYILVFFIFQKVLELQGELCPWDVDGSE